MCRRLPWPGDVPRRDFDVLLLVVALDAQRDLVSGVLGAQLVEQFLVLLESFLLKAITISPTCRPAVAADRRARSW